MIWTLDCLTLLDGQTSLPAMVDVSEEDARFMSAFYRNVSVDYAGAMNFSFFVGTWSATPELVLSGANGHVAESPSDFGIETAYDLFGSDRSF